jgi:CheY-like chemotaxis protein
MQLPGMSGEEMLRRLRRHWSAAELPVIVVSANALPDQIAAVMRLGVLHYVAKPVDVPALLQKLDEALLDRPPATLN